VASVMPLVLSSANLARGSENLQHSMLEPRECLALNFENVEQGLDSVMLKATENKLSKSSEYRYTSSKYDLKAAKSYFLPSITLQTSYSPTLSDNYYSTEYDLNSTLVEDFENNYNQTYIYLDITWNILNFSQFNLIDSLENTKDAQKHNIQFIQQSNAMEASNAYFDILSSYQTLQSLKDQETIYSKGVVITKDLVEIGLKSKIDLMNTTRQLNEYKSQIQNKKAEIESQITSLEEITSNSICRKNEKLATIGKSFFESIKSYDNDIDVIARSPAIKQLDARIESQNKLSSYYQTNYLPTVYINGSIIGTYLDGIGSPAYYKDYDTTAKSVSIGFSWSIFDGGANIANAKSAQFLAKSYKEDKENEIDSIRFNIKTIVEKEKYLIESNNQIKNSLEKQINISDLVYLNYQEGFSSYYDFQSAMQSLLQAKLALIQTSLEINRNSMSLEKYLMFPSFVLTNQSINQSF
jgi:outer membrane protein TolC